LRGDEIGLGKLPDELHIDRERNEVLLNTVMKRTLDPATLGVGRGNHSSPGRAKRLDLEVELIARAVDDGPPCPGFE
jgi:hypothetical protein